MKDPDLLYQVIGILLVIVIALSMVAACVTGFNIGKNDCERKQIHYEESKSDWEKWKENGGGTY